MTYDLSQYLIDAPGVGNHVPAKVGLSNSNSIVNPFLYVWGNDWFITNYAKTMLLKTQQLVLSVFKVTV